MAKSILICDDAAFMRMMIKDILTKNGYAIAGEAENGAKAVEKYNETKPDLVLMDITMPEMDGIQALKKIKEADANAAVIMCSAMGQQAMVIEAIQSGAKDFIVKPFQAERVQQRFRNPANRARLPSEVHTTVHWHVLLKKVPNQKTDDVRDEARLRQQ